MQRPRNMDFTCPACGARFERLVETRETDGAPLASEMCTCGAELEAVDPVLLAPVVRDGRTALDRCKS